MSDGSAEERVYGLERDIDRLERKMDTLLTKLNVAQEERRRLAADLEERERGEEILMAALSLTPEARIGDRGILTDMDDSILRLEDYLLAMGERVQRILGMLQSHKELLNRVEESVLDKGERDRLRLELDIAMNSISILAVAGVEVDTSIPAEMEKLRRSLVEEDEDLEPLRERKEELVRRLEGELRKYDLEQLFAKRSHLPGYR